MLDLLRIANRSSLSGGDTGVREFLGQLAGRSYQAPEPLNSRRSLEPNAIAWFTTDTAALLRSTERSTGWMTTRFGRSRPMVETTFWWRKQTAPGPRRQRC